MKNFKRNLKRIILLIILLIPVCVFLFLKFFGENKFSVPVYFSGGARAGQPDCQDAPPFYRISCIPFITGQDGNCDSTIFRNKITFVSMIDASDSEAGQIHHTNIYRILSDIDSPEILQSVSVYADHGSPSADSLKENNPKYIISVRTSPEQVSYLGRCVLFLPGKYDLFSTYTLVDTRGRIRGFYDFRSFEEIDRLILEIKILLNEMNSGDEK